MSKYHIQVRDEDTGQTDLVDTDGIVLLYLEQGKIKIIGKIELSEIGPLLAKFLVEKLVK